MGRSGERTLEGNRWIIAGAGRSLFAVFMGLTAIAGPAGSADSAAAQESSGLPPWNEMLEGILAGIDHNRENLGLVKLTFATKISSPAVRKEGPVRETLPDGMVLEYSDTRQSQARSNVFLLDNRVREERLDDAARVVSVMLFDGRAWTSLDHTRRAAAIERPERVAGRVPADPIEAMSLQHGTRTLERVLRESPFERRAAVSVPAGGALWLVRLSVPGLATLPHEYEFDPKRNFLPVRARAYHADGSLYLTAEAEYRHVPERDAWVPQTVSQKVFSPGQAGRPSAAGWNSHILVQLESLELLDTALASTLFSLEFPAGTAVRDTINERYYRVGGLPPGRSAFFQYYFWISAGSLAVLFVFIIVLGRRYLRSASRHSG